MNQLLDYMHGKGEFKPRDIDLIIETDPPFSLQETKQLAENLGNSDPSIFPSRRIVHGKLTEVGFHFSTQVGGQDLMLDLSLANDPSYIETNGLVSIEHVLIPLGRSETLTSWLNENAHKNYDQLLSEGRVFDPIRGYLSWRSGELSIFNWPEIEKIPTAASIRIVRAAARLNSKIRHSDIMRLKNLISEKPADEIELLRSTTRLKRTLQDSNSEAQIKILKSIGVPVTRLIGIIRRECLTGRLIVVNLKSK